MTTEQQRTFGETVGLDPVVPTRAHPQDPDSYVLCADGTACLASDAHFDSEGDAYSSAEEAHDADVQIVTDLLTEIDGWVTSYATENDDYASGYCHIVDECSHDWGDRIEEWIRDKKRTDGDNSRFEDKMGELVAMVVDDIQGSFDCEVEYHPSDYACYSGPGCCLYSFDIGEVEEQNEISAHPVLQTLHDKGTLDDVLDDVNCDAYVSRDKRRVKNEKTGYYEGVGRETYDVYGSDHPDVMTYHQPGGQWQFVVPADRMEQVVTDAIITLCRRVK